MKYNLRSNTEWSNVRLRMSQYHLWPTIYPAYLGRRPIIIIIGAINLLEYDDNIFIAQSRTNVEFYGF